MDDKKQPTDLILNQDNTATWTFREEGATTGDTYSGTFIFRLFLTPTQVLAAGRTYRELLGINSNEATEDERFIAYALSQLAHRILKSPPFWKTESMMAGDISDINILMLVLDKATTAAILYQEQLKKKKEEVLGRASAAFQNIQNELTPNLEK